MRNILLITMLCLCTALGAWAERISVDGIDYKLDKENCTAEVRDYAGSPTEVAIPASVAHLGVSYRVTIIGEYAFSGCSSLTSISLPEGVTSIGSDAFYGCSGLTSITIPASVTSIGGSLFYMCRNLTKVYCMGDSPAVCGDNSFGGNTYKNTTLYVPIGSTEAYRNAEGWRDFKTIVEFDPSGIEDIAGETDGKPQPVYDLQGRRLPGMQRGLNIIGGRKVMVK